MPTHRLCWCIVAACVALLLAQPSSAQIAAPGGKPVPKLVLFMVVDGFPQEQLVKYYDQYGQRGFKLWLDKGAWYGNNHYSHATTYTGVGHATLLSCAHPYKHGVVGNDWIDKATGKRLYSTEDARYKYLDEPTAQHAGTSPFNMKVTTVGDELLYANGKSKVIAISGKDRSSIGLAGQTRHRLHAQHGDRAVHHVRVLHERLPGVVEVVLRQQAAGQVLRPDLDAAAAGGGLRALGPGQSTLVHNYKGLGTRFPHASAGDPKEPNPAYYDTMMWTPFGDLLTLDFVKAAIEGENLGSNPVGRHRHSRHQLDQPRLRQSPVRSREPPVAGSNRSARSRLRGAAGLSRPAYRAAERADHAVRRPRLHEHSRVQRQPPARRRAHRSRQDDRSRQRVALRQVRRGQVHHCVVEPEPLCRLSARRDRKLNRVEVETAAQEVLRAIRASKRCSPARSSKTVRCPRPSWRSR